MTENGQKPTKGANLGPKMAGTGSMGWENGPDGVRHGPTRSDTGLHPENPPETVENRQFWSRNGREMAENGLKTVKNRFQMVFRMFPRGFRGFLWFPGEASKSSHWVIRLSVPLGGGLPLFWAYFDSIVCFDRPSNQSRNRFL